MGMIEHAPQGTPCHRLGPQGTPCGEPPDRHRAPRVRPYHEACGDPCDTCGKPAKGHRSPASIAARAAYDAKREASGEGRQADRKIIGIDGEGQDTPDGRHIYTYLAAVDEHGTCVSEAYNAEGLTHDECAEMLLAIPRNALKFGFMFSYDVTKIIEDMPLSERFYLMRPNARIGRKCNDKACATSWYDARRTCPTCDDALGAGSRSFNRNLRWKGRQYGFFNGSLSISNSEGAAPDVTEAKPWLSKPLKLEKAPGKRNVKIWDCFRFFGCAFTSALRNWRISSDPNEPWFQKDASETTAEIERIADMKAQRGSFDSVDPDKVKAYCKSECHLLALMMRKVIDSHDQAGIHLTRYEGAGSTAGALLKLHKVQDFKGPKLADMDPHLAYAISCAFFGGRFENSEVGAISDTIHGYDISSAYPYALSDLPCLACGRWRRITVAKLGAEKFRKAFARCTLALGRFRVKAVPGDVRKTIAWGPLPFRDEKGSIAFGTNFDGWAWRPELQAALDGWPDIVRHMGEAWVYETECDHAPFAFLPAVYRERVRWGKDGAGIVLKLGPNAVYGRTAQGVGEDPPYQAWAWAGMTTATCRGQLLRMIASTSKIQKSTAPDRWHVKALATDGIYATSQIATPAPRDTGTGDLKKPLGGWEYKEIEEGVFLCKPGLYFKLKHPQLDDIRARGVGRREVFEQREALMAQFAAWDRKDFTHHLKMKSRRFYGAKHSVLAQSGCKACGTRWPGVPEQLCPTCGQLGTIFRTSLIKTPKLADGSGGDPAYGTWSVRTSEVRFDPFPKRERKLRRGGTSARLTVRDLGGRTSAAYDCGVRFVITDKFGDRFRLDGTGPQVLAPTTPEGMAARDAKEFALEQPDWEEG